MRRHLSYLKYLLRHKYYVFVAGRLTKAPIWNLLVHDASKFLPSEWFPYAEAFYRPDGTSRWVESLEFNLAWLAHIKRNPHHWQHWVLLEDSGATVPLPMPDVYIREMVADWAGAGRAISGRWDLPQWYAANKKKMLLHPTSRARAEILIELFERETKTK